ncbi:RlmE family RNA methyltransferase [Aquibaculum arenosum]|uniref:Ribosomal RNA large subunit methyltransferase E n=1 Tax=Aquibaculum arenosum TaxID=3032591 RepID=A0ABT5YK50_9PROT|nr:RlmE family RNA methyltransferase [Fodinicurvata sp. CAU 1616]MDF2095308.1 RlmE family RNA methyltransferase [Fodinicurvata sp. CAU 1616]
MSGRSAGKSGRGQRQLRQRVQTAKGRRASSVRWLERQLNDPWVAEAKAQGYRSRAAFKLLQIDEKVKLLKPGQRVVDLGAAPGGWSQVAARRVGAKGKVVGIDLLPVDPLPGVDLMQLDFLDDTAPDQLRARLGGPADLVLSDMAPPTSGHSSTDHLRIMGLAEAALDFAEEVLAPGGGFVAKVWQGGSEKELLDRLKRCFAKVRHIKPPSSRAESPELFVVATGYRPPSGQGSRVESADDSRDEAGA